MRVPTVPSVETGGHSQGVRQWAGVLGDGGLGALAGEARRGLIEHSDDGLSERGSTERLVSGWPF